MAKDTPFTSVVISTYNRKKLLKNQLKLLFNQRYPKDKYEILVINGGSTDGTKDTIEELQNFSPAPLRFFKQEGRGLSNARNTGIKNANGDIIAFTDDDCMVDKDWLRNLANPFKDKTIVGVEGKVVMDREKTPFTHLVENLDGKKYVGANVAYRRETLIEVGMFDESFGIGAVGLLDDTEIALKVLKIGGKIIFCEKAIVTHPARELSLIESFRKGRALIRSFILMHETYPEAFRNLIPGSLIGFLVFMIFIRPLSFLGHWRNYFMKHPTQIPKFLITRIANSLYAIYLLNAYMYKKFKKMLPQDHLKIRL